MSVCIWLVGALAIATIWVREGVPVLDVAKRASVNQHLVFLGCAMIPSALMMFILLRDSKRHLSAFLVVAVSAGFLASLAYRSRVALVLSMMIVAMHFRGRGISMLKVSLVGVAAACAAALFGAWRTVQVYGVGKADLKGSFVHLTSLEGLKTFLGYGNMNFFREGSSIFYFLLGYHDRWDRYLLGRMSTASFVSMLPGHQASARDIVAMEVYGENPTTLTPSLMGPPYMDFGVPGILVAMAVLGILMGLFYRVAQSRKPTSVLAYAYLWSTSVKCIHGGLTDPVNIVFMPAIILGFSVLYDYHVKAVGTVGARPLQGQL